MLSKKLKFMIFKSLHAAVLPILFLLAFPLFAFAQIQDEPAKKFSVRLPLISGTRYDSNFFSRIFLHHSLSRLLTEYHQFSVSETESQADFNFASGNIFSLAGGSWLWNSYEYQGVDISDPFYSGRAMHSFPLDGLNLVINAEQHKIIFSPLEEQQEFFVLRSLAGNIGPAIAYWKTFAKIPNHVPPQLRDILPPEERKGSVAAFEMFRHFRWPVFKENSFLNIDMYNRLGKTKHLNYDENGMAGVFYETSYAFHVKGNLRIPKHAWQREKSKAGFAEGDGLQLSQAAMGMEEKDEPEKKDFYNAGFLFSYLFRDKAGSEFYYLEQETSLASMLAVTGYFENTGEQLTQRYALSLAHKNTRPNKENFPYNIYRLTGQGLSPFRPFGDLFILKNQLSFVYDFALRQKNFFKLFVDSKNSILLHLPKQNNFEHAVYYADDAGSYKSLYLKKYATKKTAYALLEQEVYFSVNEKKKHGFYISARAGFDVDALVLPKESKAFISPTFRIHMQMLSGVYGSLSLTLGRENLPFNSEYAKFISDGYASSKNYVWNDANANKKAESTELELRGVLHSSSGGASARFDDSFRQPHYYYIDLPYHLPIFSSPSKDWYFSLLGHYRIFRQQAWVCYDGKPLDYGEYKDVVVNEDDEDSAAVFFETNGAKRYTVCNMKPSFFPAKKRTWFNNAPLYLSATTGFSGSGERFYFSLFFTAYLINGVTYFGNGPSQSTLGILDTSMADPNNFSAEVGKPIGRYSADRSYLGRLLFSYAYLKNFISTVTLSYRDGRPFGSFQHVFPDENGKHPAVLRKNVSGDNLLLYKGEFGKRDDANWNVDLRFLSFFDFKNGSRIEITLGIYNLLDLALSTLESAMTGKIASVRAALDLQVARGIELEVRYLF